MRRPWLTRPQQIGLTAHSPSLSPDAEVAVNFAGSRQRPLLATLLAFDAMMRRQVAAVREPLLGRLRLAWWREVLASPAEAAKLQQDVPGLDVLLNAVGAQPLLGVIDGWDALLDVQPFAEQTLRDYAAGRAGVFRAGAILLGGSDGGEAWALADFVIHATNATSAGRARALLQHSPVDLPSLAKPLRVLTRLAFLRLEKGVDVNRWALLRATFG